MTAVRGLLIKWPKAFTVWLKIFYSVATWLSGLLPLEFLSTIVFSKIQWKKEKVEKLFGGGHRQFGPEVGLVSLADCWWPNGLYRPASERFFSGSLQSQLFILLSSSTNSHYYYYYYAQHSYYIRFLCLYWWWLLFLALTFRLLGKWMQFLQIAKFYSRIR